jgi:WD40 repeat protein
MEPKCLCVACLVLFGSLLAILHAATPKQELRPTIHCILGKSADIHALDFSPDGKKVLAAEEAETNYQVVEWDITTKSVGRRFASDHSGQIVSLSYSQSGRFVVVGHGDGFVSIRDRRGKSLLSFNSIENPGATLRLAAISENERPFVYTVVGNNIAQRRSIPAGKTSVYSIPCDGGFQITSAAVARYGTTFVCCSPKFMNVYQHAAFDSPLAINSFKVFDEPCVTHVAISDDSSLVMAAEYYGELALFDIKKDSLINKWRGHDDAPIYTVLPFHTRNWFATSNDSGEIKIWDERGRLCSMLKVKDICHPVTALALTRDDSFLASSGEARPIVLWDLRAFLRETSRTSE